MIAKYVLHSLTRGTCGGCGGDGGEPGGRGGEGPHDPAGGSMAGEPQGRSPPNAAQFGLQ
eukprot:124197-Prymnesium_polylepis.2